MIVGLSGVATVVRQTLSIASSLYNTQEDPKTGPLEARHPHFRQSFSRRRFDDGLNFLRLCCSYRNINRRNYLTEILCRISTPLRAGLDVSDFSDRQRLLSIV